VTTEESVYFSNYRTWIEKLDAQKKSLKKTISFYDSPFPGIKLHVPKLDILDLDPSEICAQLTLLDYRAFCGINESEFLFKAFLKEDRSPNYHQMVKRINTVRRNSFEIQKKKKDVKANRISVLYQDWIMGSFRNFGTTNRSTTS
jgi:hypothetical protein